MKRKPVSAKSTPFNETYTLTSPAKSTPLGADEQMIVVAAFTSDDSSTGSATVTPASPHLQ